MACLPLPELELWILLLELRILLLELWIQLLELWFRMAALLIPRQMKADKYATAKGWR